MDEPTILDPRAAAAGVASEATQQAITIVCPICQTPNPPGDRWCQDCGFLLGSTPAGEVSLPDTSAMPRLSLLSQPGRELFLRSGNNSVGRENADVLLADPTVSRRHAQITVEESGVWVEDLGSTNGTKVAGQRLAAGERVPLYDGDEVVFGTVALRAILPGIGPRPAEVPAASAPSPDRGPVVGTLIADDGREFPLYAGVNTLGRRSSNQIVLTGDAYVSGQHAEIRCEGGSCVIVDLGSTNGTVVRGERLTAHTPVPLGDGESFQVGRTLLTLRWSGSPGAGEDAEPTSCERSEEAEA